MRASHYTPEFESSIPIGVQESAERLNRELRSPLRFLPLAATCILLFIGLAMIRPYWPIAVLLITIGLAILIAGTILRPESEPIRQHPDTMHWRNFWTVLVIMVPSWVMQYVHDAYLNNASIGMHIAIGALFGVVVFAIYLILLPSNNFIPIPRHLDKGFKELIANRSLSDAQLRCLSVLYAAKTGKDDNVFFLESLPRFTDLTEAQVHLALRELANAHLVETKPNYSALTAKGRAKNLAWIV